SIRRIRWLNCPKLLTTYIGSIPDHFSLMADNPFFIGAFRKSPSGRPDYSRHQTMYHTPVPTHNHGPCGGSFSVLHQENGPSARQGTWRLRHPSLPSPPRCSTVQAPNVPVHRSRD